MVFSVLGHEVECGPVEGAGLHIAYAGPKETAAQLVAGLASEGHGEDVVRRDLPVGNAPLDPQGEYVRLARACGGAHEMPARW